jgi:hypothetical protein
MISTHIQRMREKLRAGKIVLGVGISLSDPTVTEAIAPSVDFVWIDLEHNALSAEEKMSVEDPMAMEKLADSDAYRLEVTGKASTEQMAREAALLAKNPLLIQKTLADKLSDKISVIIAPPNTNGFIASGILGTPPAAPQPKPASDE